MHFRVNESNFATLRDRDQPSDEVFRMAEEIREMTATPGWALVVRLIEEARQYHYHVLTADHASWDEMSRRLGLIEGLRGAEAAMDAVIDKDAQVRHELDRLAGSEQGG